MIYDAEERGIGSKERGGCMGRGEGGRWEGTVIDQEAGERGERDYDRSVVMEAECSVAHDQ